MNTYIKKMTELLSKVDAACVFARSKNMARLTRHLDHPNGTPTLQGIAITLGVGGFVLGGVCASLNWVQPGIAAAWSVGSGMFIPLTFMVINTSRLERCKKQAQAAGVCVMKGANENASATIKMNILDECEKIVPPEQIDALKKIAQRDDVPLGWWQNMAETVREYQENKIKQHNDHNTFLSEQRAQERLASLSTVAVAQSSCTAIQDKDPKRLIV